ncbi:hypothetical protein [Kitasatospora cineracea]|uniref:hypothetical protein n=1 Tax=Kitasatospora cineracea TaxID=88074 RepID=UPI00382AA396
MKKWLVVAGAVLVVGGLFLLFGARPRESGRAVEPVRPGTTAGPTAGATAVGTPSARVTDTAPAQPSGVPSPDREQTAALVAALRAVDPLLVGRQDRVVDRARNVCWDLREGRDPAVVERNAAALFGTEAFVVSEEQAAGIVDAVKGSFCG